MKNVRVISNTPKLLSIMIPDETWAGIEDDVLMVWKRSFVDPKENIVIWSRKVGAPKFMYKNNGNCFPADGKYEVLPVFGMGSRAEQSEQLMQIAGQSKKQAIKAMAGWARVNLMENVWNEYCNTRSMDCRVVMVFRELHHYAMTGLYEDIKDGDRMVHVTVTNQLSIFGVAK